MLWCQSAQNIGLSNCKLKSMLTCTAPYDHNARPSQTDEHHSNSQQFILTNARCANEFNNNYWMFKCCTICQSGEYFCEIPHSHDSQAPQILRQENNNTATVVHNILKTSIIPTHRHTGTPVPHWRSAAAWSLGRKAQRRAAYMCAYWRWKFRCGSTKRSLWLVYVDSTRVNVLQSESHISSAIVSVLYAPRYYNCFSTDKSKPY